MNERQVTVDGHPHPLPNPFLVVATQNPVEHHGTYPLPESQLDRFLIRARMGYPEAGSEREILRGRAGAALIEELRPVLTAEDVVALQNDVDTVRVEDSLIDYSLAIVERTRQHEQLSLGVSPRGALMLYHAAQAMALLEGRTYCIPDDFKRLTIPTFAHRLVISARYTSTLKRAEQSEQILREVVESVPVPV
jgi:MoxR-like ATPase